MKLRLQPVVIPTVFGIVLVAVTIYLSGRYGLAYSYTHFDTIMHFVGGVISAWIVVALFRHDLSSLRQWVQVAMTIGLVLIIGLAWEIAEFSTIFIKDSYPAVHFYFQGGDVRDTLGDLIVDMVGGIVFSGLYVYYQHRTLEITSATKYAKDTDLV